MAGRRGHGARRSAPPTLYVETSSRPQYEPTRAFYGRLGYHVAAELPDFYGPGDGQVIFAKRLPFDHCAAVLVAGGGDSRSRATVSMRTRRSGLPASRRSKSRCRSTSRWQ